MGRIIKKLYSILTARQKKYLVILIIMMLIGGVMESFSISLMLPLVSAITDSKSWDRTWYARLICDLFRIDNHRAYIVCLMVILIIIFIAKNVYLLVEYFYQYTFSSRCSYNMQYRLLERYMNVPYVFFLNSSTGEIVRILNTDTVHAYTILELLISMLTEVIICIALGITIFVMSPWMALGIVAILLAELFAIMKLIRPRMVRYGDVARKNSAIANQWMLQSLDGIKSIKVSKEEDYFLGKYNHYFSTTVEVNKRYNTMKTVPRLMIESCTICSILGAMSIMIMNGVELESLIPILSAFVLAAMRLLPSANRISMAVGQIPYLEGGLDNVMKIITGEGALKEIDSRVWNETEEERMKEISKGKKIEFNKSIKLDNITFSYPGSTKKILDHGNMEIKSLQSVGIVGSSGGGKTTTVDIMLGLLKPQEGRILVDGMDISDKMDSWLDNVAYIPQQIFLIDGTIRANIAFGKDKDIDDDKVMEAAREAQLLDFIESLPDGLDSEIGEQGVRLSGGQRQRIGIARALYSDAKVLFFDEATSALDNETEKAVMEAINSLKKKKTMVIIAHRLTTIENCDVVYRIEDGKITGENNEA